MAKDVDLSSKEWTDIIFEGKNKEFGAYQMRKKSDRRHNLALIWTLVGLALILLGGWAWSAYSEYKAEEAAKEAELLALEQARLAELEAVNEPDEVDEPEPENLMKDEPEQVEALKEEILNTEKFTEFIIVKDEEAVEVRTDEEARQSDTALGHVDFDEGTDDLNIVREHKNEVIVEEKKPEPEPDQVFQSVEQMPQFPGGDAELMKYISSHIKYPTMAMENNIQGRVVVQFVVTKTGAIGEVKVVRSKDPDLDREAVRVVKSLPNFIPGKMNGQAVNVWYTLPVNFKLQGI